MDIYKQIIEAIAEDRLYQFALDHKIDLPTRAYMADGYQELAEAVAIWALKQGG